MTGADTLPFSWYSTRSCCGASAARSSPARGSTPAARPRSRSRARSPRPTQAASRSSSRATARRAACIPQRLPPPRRGARGRLRSAEHDPVPLPRLDLRPRRVAASRAACRPRARLRPGRLVAAAGRASAPGGRSSSSTPTRTPRRSPSTWASCRSSSPRDLDVDELVFHSRVEFGANCELEDRGRELPRVLPLPDRPSRVQRRGRRPSRPLPARGPPDLRRPVLHEQVDRRARPVPSPLPEYRINVFPGPPNLSIGPIVPNGPGRTERYLDYFFAPGVDAAWRREFFAFDDQVGREDRALVESVHRGMASGMLDHGRLLLNAEPLLAAFQRWVAGRLA